MICLAQSVFPMILESRQVLIFLTLAQSPRKYSRVWRVKL